MKALALIAVAALAAAPLQKERAALNAYHGLTPQELVTHVVAELPDGNWRSVDASDRIRSISFGHTTTLWVGDSVFYVEFGRSTNAPGRLMGPFALR
jgi:hypothetical protein